MARIHLFEFEDQVWFPSFLRNYVTDFLQLLSNKAKVYESVVDEIAEVTIRHGSNKIIDLGSGGGGGLLWLSGVLQKKIPNLKITLTDLYPNISAFEYTKSKSSVIDYSKQPVDATDVPTNLQGFRTQFLSFHHFKPAQAIQIIQTAVDSNQAIGIFEIQDRSLSSLLVMLFSPLSVMVITPMIKPFNLGRIIFTYLIPIIPLVVLWDGIVSCLRTYSVDELHGLLSNVQYKDKFDWKIDKKKGKAGFVILLIGTPK
jgi:ActR/RegA family two-component response regulator